MKKNILILACFVGFITLSPFVHAADVNVVCGSTVCTPQTVDQFFPNTEIWYPGKTLVKQIKVTNTSGVNVRIGVKGMHPQTTGDIDQVIQFTITKSDGSVLWDGSLHAFYASGETTLFNALGNSASETFDFTANMYNTATNEYQKKTTTFTMVIGYVYAPTATPSPCTAQKPAIPRGVSISRVNDTDAKLTWDYVSEPSTGYFVSWGTNTDADNVGTRSLGKTNETLIGGLELHFKRYYFKVRAVNDCAIGDFGSVVTEGTRSNLLDTNTPSPTPSTGQALGIHAQQEVLFGKIQGVATSEGILRTSPKEKGLPPTDERGDVQGTATNCKCIWWQILLGEVLLTGLYIWVGRKNLQSRRYVVGAVLVTFIVPLLVFRLVNSCVSFSFLILADTPSLWCRYFVILDAFILLLMWVLVTKIVNTKSSSRDLRMS